MKNNKLHTKLLLMTSAALLTSFPNGVSAMELELKSAFSDAGSFKLAKVCFLPDCEKELSDATGGKDINKDSKWCEKKGFTYYATGACPQYQKETERCNKDDNYLKCDAASWCKDNGYNTSTCSLPKFVDTQCPNGQPLYKSCKEDTAKACKQLGYKNTCSGGQKLHASSGRCSWNNSYGTCCSPSGCPSYTSLSYSSYGANGSDGCGYTCYYTCNMNCPSGTSTSNPGGCGGSTRNGCNTKTCYYPYQACCTPNCTNQSGCAYGTTSVSDGCGGSCTRCKEQPCNSSHPRWCRVHGSCHTDCCSDGSIQSCDPQCGGSGCGGGSGGGSGGGISGDGSSCDHYGSGYTYCCDTNLSYDYSFCRKWAVDCSSPKNACTSHGGSWSFVRNVTCGGIYSGYAEYHCSAGTVW